MALYDILVCFPAAEEGLYGHDIKDGDLNALRASMPKVTFNERSTRPMEFTLSQQLGDFNSEWKALRFSVRTYAFALGQARVSMGFEPSERQALERSSPCVRWLRDIVSNCLINTYERHPTRRKPLPQASNELLDRYTERQLFYGDDSPAMDCFYAVGQVVILHLSSLMPFAARS